MANSKGWGSSRKNSGRKAKAVEPAQSTRMRNTVPPCGSLGAAASSSIIPSAVWPAINNAGGTSATRFFAPQVSQQLQVVAQLAQDSTAPVQPPSTSTVISELNKDLTTAALDDPPDSTDCVFDESLGDEDDEGDNSVNADVAQKETEEAEVKTLSENHQWLKTTLAQIILSSVNVERS
ncbi:hypothetical protein B0H14DRAFT_2583015 [Mycena olivaceomarginata]|nr:hypothetical protein B0H14DRAFT_2583015 [Mycena olivaceomarginata]